MKLRFSYKLTAAPIRVLPDTALLPPNAALQLHMTASSRFDGALNIDIKVTCASPLKHMVWQLQRGDVQRVFTEHQRKALNSKVANRLEVAWRLCTSAAGECVSSTTAL